MSPGNAAPAAAGDAAPRRTPTDGVCQRCRRYYVARTLHPLLEAWLCGACAGWIDYLTARGVDLTVTWECG